MYCSNHGNLIVINTRVLNLLNFYYIFVYVLFIMHDLGSTHIHKKNVVFIFNTYFVEDRVHNYMIIHKTTLNVYRLISDSCLLMEPFTIKVHVLKSPVICAHTNA